MAQQSGLVAGNQQNLAGGTVPHNRSRFPLSKSFFNTERFADYTPVYCMEAVSGDKLTLNQPHQVRTYTLKSPLLQDLLKKKDFFMVPMQAILPLNWEKFYTNPTIGDDVPDGVGTSVLNFWSRLATIFSSDWNALKTYIYNASNSDANSLERIIKFLVYYEQFYSSGCLLKSLDNSGNAYFRCTLTSGVYVKSPTYDEVFDILISDILAPGSGVDYFVCSLNNITYNVMCAGQRWDENQLYNINVITFRQFLEMVREDLATFSVSSVTNFGTSDWRNDVYSDMDAISLGLPAATGTPLNIARLAAYQIVCSHYYSNDHIDVLYSAELYREYMYSLMINTFSSNSVSSNLVTFLYNGVRYNYDSLSAWVVNRMLVSSSGTPSFTSVFTSVFVKGAGTLAYISSLFGYKRSLRFMDYFTGSRAYPLAIGNETTIDTSGSNVSVLDVTKKFQYTRFYQAINRAGRKFSNYMKEMFGKFPAPDYHNPFFLAHTSDVVGGQEIENTGVDQLTKQNSVTTVLRSNAARYAFTFEPDRDCIIIGITYYDLPRVYTRATQRQWFDKDRFDMFNPFLQYLGDQAIWKAELGVGDMSIDQANSAFSYCNRDMQYKQFYNTAAGGFCVPSTQLPDWFYPAEVLRRPYKDTIGSTFIRSFSSEFDRFYVSLTGYSLGTYFHFIVRYDDRMDASRPMAYAPGILQ